jgi:16S rRNA (cytosine1407-C5)-methyltransferase
MKRNNPADKLAKKKQAWVTRTSLVLGISEAEATVLLATERKQSIRINPLLTSTDSVLVGEAGFEPPITESEPGALTPQRLIGKQYSWMPEGYMLDTAMADIRDDELVTSGKIFIQNAASWLPVLALDPQSGDDILDVCAAPGGKTSHIAAITRNGAHIIANDNSRPRLAKLRATMDRLGATADYTLYDATMLARKLEGREFDRILIDAPCSGEGLMNITRDKDFATWSVAHIKRLQQLQKRILTQSWQLLKPGGTLVYSTCTMAPEEDEAVIDYLLRMTDDATVQPLELALPNRVSAVSAWNGKKYTSATAACMRLMPSEHIEAFFVCKLQKQP